MKLQEYINFHQKKEMTIQLGASVVITGEVLKNSRYKPMEKITTDTIMGFLKENIEEKRPLFPEIFADAAAKLNVLIGDEVDLLADLQQKVAQLKVDLLEQDKSVAEAKVRVEATDEYKQMVKQSAKIKQIEEFIRIMKIRSRLKSDEYRL
jgi:hypothetical protein